MIQVQNLVKKFGDFTAVKDISFTVEAGEIFAFLGPNGAGKTTTIKMLTTLLNPTSGKIELDGLDPTVQKNEARRTFGIVFQDPSLTASRPRGEHGTPRGALQVPRKVRAERIEQLLRLFELWERRDDYVKTFSGGMKRRLEIARGFLHTPKILFLDEPTLGLDPQTRNQLWTHVKHLNETQKTTVFLTTHYMDEADRVAHRIAVIDHGGIVAQGTPQELKQQTNSGSLEQAFLSLTGSSIRDERDLRRPDAASRQNVGESQMSAIYILWLRELKRYVRSRAQIVASLGQPLLYLLVLGFGLGPVFQRAGNGSYLQFVAPGVISMTILFSAIFSGIAMLWDRQFGFLKETLVAPVPRIEVMIGRTLGGATVAVIQGTLILIVCLIAGFRRAQLSLFPLAFVFMALIAIVFAALGTAFGAILQDMQGFQLIMISWSPDFLLSGALFPPGQSAEASSYHPRGSIR
jgi:ABC-2 type transport system ATP-binding protein